MKILGSDFDGTLTVGGIDEVKCEAVRAWRRAGNRFGIVSGRGLSYLNHLREQYPALEMVFFAAYNGAFIVDAEGETLDTTACNGVSAFDLTADLLGWGCPFVYVNGPSSYTVRQEGHILRDGESHLEDLPRDIPWFHQISVQLETTAEAAEAVEKIQAIYGVNPLQNGICIDIVAPAVNKAYGLRRVAAHFGATEADILAVGDNLNDLDMLKAFRSYAMKNGVEEVKRVAGRTVGTVTEFDLP